MPCLFRLAGIFKAPMKPFMAFLFYFISTVILGVGVWKAVDQGALWLLLVGVLGYLGLFIRYGCQSH